MSSEGVRLEVVRDIAHLVLDSPPRNEMGTEFFRNLNKICREILPTLDVAGMIVRGEGRHFSSGANLEQIVPLGSGSGPDGIRFLQENSGSLSYIDDLQYPVVAAIRGCCIGSGLELALACDIRIAAPRAVFSFPEVTFGVIPGCGGTVRLERLLGAARSVSMLLSAEMLLAEDALAAGLIDAVVEKNELIGSAERMIELTRVR